MNNVEEAALTYTRRGMRVIPIPHKSKNPGILGWEKLRITVEGIPTHFIGGQQNVETRRGFAKEGAVLKVAQPSSATVLTE